MLVRCRVCVLVRCRVAFACAVQERRRVALARGACLLVVFIRQGRNARAREGG